MRQAERVVLVHGLWMNRLMMAFLGQHLRRAGYEVRSFGYLPTMRPFAEQVERFAAHLRALPPRHTHFVCHSLGGVLLLATLPRLADQDIGRAVLLGSPLRGSLGAMQFMQHVFGRFCVGATADLWHSFPTLQCPAHCEVGVIAGTRSLGLGRLFTKLPRPNDGVVTVEETRLPDLSDHLELPVSHTGMLFSRAVALRTTRFLRTGKFTE